MRRKQQSKQDMQAEAMCASAWKQCVLPPFCSYKLTLSIKPAETDPEIMPLPGLYLVFILTVSASMPFF